jgi:hypothetical protein
VRAALVERDDTLRRARKDLAGARSIVALLTVKFRQPSHEFTFCVGMAFVSYPLVLTPVV